MPSTVAGQLPVRTEFPFHPVLETGHQNGGKNIQDGKTFVNSQRTKGGKKRRKEEST
jgi:hypothetical protein